MREMLQGQVFISPGFGGMVVAQSMSTVSKALGGPVVAQSLSAEFFAESVARRISRRAKIPAWVIGEVVPGERAVTWD
jgi:hypothetical protein